MKWLSYPGRTSNAATAAEIDFAVADSIRKA